MKTFRAHQLLKPLVLKPLVLAAPVWFAFTAWLAPSALAQDGARWYQIEITVFTNESNDIALESWPDPDLAFPSRLRTLDSVLDHLTLNDWSLLSSPAARPVSDMEADPELQAPSDEGPEALQNGGYRLPDARRDAYVSLPASEHTFTDTNRALTSSPAYRVLYHDAWRQPVMRAAQATPIAILAGRAFGTRHELEGSITIRFNQSQDRVVLDTNLWLSQFTRLRPVDGESTELPALPESLRQALRLGDENTRADEQLDATINGQIAVQETEENDGFYVSAIFPMQDSRDMRSNEFHYLDHPAMGILIQVFPYELPPAQLTPIQENVLPL